MEPFVANFVGSICDGSASSASCSEFFSRANIDALQRKIVDQVLQQHNYCIQTQSEPQLLLLMRSMWANYGSALGVAGTNDKVVAEAVNIIKINIDMHEVATRFLYKNPEPLPWGEATNVRGTKMQ